MTFQKETKWFCENAKGLEKFAGQWVLFSAHEGLVGNGESLAQVLKAARHKKAKNTPFVFHIPSKEELVTSPLSIPVRQVSR